MSFTPRSDDNSSSAYAAVHSATARLSHINATALGVVRSRQASHAIASVFFVETATTERYSKVMTFLPAPQPHDENHYQELAFLTSATQTRKPEVTFERSDPNTIRCE